jgi:hypothetical protein
MPTIHVHIHLHGEGFDMREAIERLQQEVEDTKNVNASARTLLGGLAQQIRDAQGDAATLNALADSLDAEQQLWAAAIEANQVPTAAPPADPPAEDGGTSSTVTWRSVISRNSGIPT